MALTNLAPAKPAQFDRATQHRRAMLAKIHIACKQLNLDEDDYRQAVYDETGRWSLAECSDPQLDKVLAWLKTKGFKPLPSKFGKGAATYPAARKARALWISLHHLGVVKNPAEQALEMFAQRQLGCERFVWANQRETFRLIEALKSMAIRNGWKQTGLDGKKLTPLVLQSHLCEVILAKLKDGGAIPADWTLERTARSLCGTEEVDFSWPFGVEQFARLAELLGRKLRTFGLVEPVQ